MRYVQLRIDAHEDPRLRRAGGVAFNVLNALARLIAREAGADGFLAPRWCDVDTIKRWACESSDLDVREALGALAVEGLVTGSLQDGLQIDPELWGDYVNERLRKRLARESKERKSATTAGPAQACSRCNDGMICRPDGSYIKCCACPRGRELARLVAMTREGERESARRKAMDTGQRSSTGLPTGIQGELDGIIGRRKAANDG